MALAQLPVSDLVSVQINLASLPAQAQNLSNILILGSSDVIDVTQRIRTYSSLSGVASDFGTSAPEYLAAAAWFGQSPQPGYCLIGEWAKTATAGRLIGAVIPAASQLITAWTSITTGSFKIGLDGGAATDKTLMDFSAQTNLNGVASIISAKIAPAVCTWDANNQQFTIKSSTTGATSAVSFLQAAASGTDISAMLGMTIASSGAYVANGIIAETAVAAVTLFDSLFGQKWYSVFICGLTDTSPFTQHLAVAAYIEASNTKHAFGINTQGAGVLSSVDTTNVAYVMKALSYKKTLVQYSSSSLYAVVSLMARIMTTDYTANKTVITLMYKTEPGIVAESLTETQKTAAVNNNANIFVYYDNNKAIIQNGVVSGGDFIDTIFGADWLAITIENSIFNLLYSNPTKIPQTNEGNNIIATGIEATMNQSVINGLCAPGTWNQAGFGALNQNDYLPKGYYIYASPIELQNPADRSARKSVTFQVAAKLAGAIHTVSVIVNINR